MRSIIRISIPVILLVLLLMEAGCTSTTTPSTTVTPSLSPAITTMTTSALVTGGTPLASVTMSTSQASGAGQTVQVALIAQNFAFDQTSLTVPAGSHVQLAFDNQDAGMQHNVAIYNSSAATTVIFKGALITGPSQTTYTFDAPTSPGTYYFRCDIHPGMNGQFIVQ